MNIIPQKKHCAFPGLGMHFLSSHSLKWSVYFDDQQVKSSQTFKVGQIQNKQNKGCKKAKILYI